MPDAHSETGYRHRPTAAYTWGLDLAGLSGAVNSRASAGGIGGLLAVREERDASYPGGDGTFYFLFTHDATGNVGQVVDLSVGTWDAETVMVARYEYEPYGGLRSSAGGYASRNPFRFSTKYWDAESGLGDWGRRFYRPDTGRWMNRDPIGERGGKNLYVYAANAPSGQYDPVGMFASGGPSACPKDEDDDREQPETGERPHEPKPGDPYGPRKPKRPCENCWKRCLDELGDKENGVLCLKNGCRCACVDKRKNPIPGVAGDIIHTCKVAHEEWHVDHPPRVKCKCDDGGKKPCFERHVTTEDRGKSECLAAAHEINCLCHYKSDCPDNNCRKKIDEHIDIVASYCTILDESGHQWPPGATDCREAEIIITPNAPRPR